MTNSDEKEARATLVGRLIKSYRDDRLHRGGRLTQEGLVELMSEVAPRQAGFDRANISRWENGRAMPTRTSLIIVGMALNMREPEINGILELAGYEALYAPLDEWAFLHRSASEALYQRRHDELGDFTWEPPFDAKTLAKDALRRAVAPAICAAAGGWALDALGMTGASALIAYAAVALAVVVGQGVPLMRRSDAAGELFFIMMFFVLNAPLFMFAVTRTDHFGFYALIPPDGSPYFLTLTLTAHLALALAASAIFDALRSWMYSLAGLTNPLIRPLGSALPPCAFALFAITVFADAGGWLFYLIALGAAVGAATALLAFLRGWTFLSGGETNLGVREAFVSVILLCAAGAAGTAAGTAAASLLTSPADAPDHSPLISWEADYERVGYPPEEFAERHRTGTLFMFILAAAHLAVALVVGMLFAAYMWIDRE